MRKSKAITFQQLHDFMLQEDVWQPQASKSNSIIVHYKAFRGYKRRRPTITITKLQPAQ